MLAFALIAYEPDFLVQFFDQGQLVTSVQLLRVLRKASESQSSLRHGRGGREGLATAPGLTLGNGHRNLMSESVFTNTWGWKPPQWHKADTW